MMSVAGKVAIGTVIRGRDGGKLPDFDTVVDTEIAPVYPAFGRRLVVGAFCVCVKNAPLTARAKTQIVLSNRIFILPLPTKTSVAEVTFHKRRFLQDARLTGQYAFEYRDFLADFSGQFHYLDSNESQACLQPGPVPQCASQALPNSLLYAGSNGIVYPSVRHSPGTCIACFRPALVFHPRRGPEHRITLRVATNAMSFEQVVH
jgi:hypothetical protein